MRFFKKLYPAQGILLSNGSWKKFADTGKWGLIATEDPFLLGEFQAAIAGQRGGITEIQAPEYEDLKKNRTPLRSFKEELTRKVASQFHKSGGNLAGVAGPVGEGESDKIAKPPGVTGFRPGGVKR